MGRIYTSEFDGVAVTAAQDLFMILTPATDIVRVHEVGLSQLTEIQDAEEVMLLLRMRSGQTSNGSGGSAPAIVPQLLGDSVCGCTVRANDTTIASGGTIVQKHSEYWNVRIPYVKIWTPETRPILPPSSRWTFELATADTFTAAGYITFEEIG